VTSSESNGAHEANDVDDWDGLFQDIIASGDESNPECDRDSDPRGDDCTDDEHGKADCGMTFCYTILIVQGRMMNVIVPLMLILHRQQMRLTMALNVILEICLKKE